MQQDPILSCLVVIGLLGGLSCTLTPFALPLSERVFVLVIVSSAILNLFFVILSLEVEKPAPREEPERFPPSPLSSPPPHITPPKRVSLPPPPYELERLRLEAEYEAEPHTLEIARAAHTYSSFNDLMKLLRETFCYKGVCMCFFEERVVSTSELLELSKKFKVFTLTDINAKSSLYVSLQGKGRHFLLRIEQGATEYSCHIHTQDPSEEKFLFYLFLYGLANLSVTPLKGVPKNFNIHYEQYNCFTPDGKREHEALLRRKIKLLFNNQHGCFTIS